MLCDAAQKGQQADQKEFSPRQYSLASLQREITTRLDAALEFLAPRNSHRARKRLYQ